MQVLAKRIGILVISCGVLAASACSSRNSGSFKKSGADAGTGSDAGRDGAAGGGSSGGSSSSNKAEQLASSYGLLNFRRLTATYAQLTGVTLATPAVATMYTAQLAALPKQNEPAQISASKVAGATKLAAVYCDTLSTNAQLLAAKFPGLSLAAVPADSMGFAKTLLDGFYGPETSMQGDRAKDIATVAATVDSLKALNKGNGAAIFMATCAAILGSAEFYLH